MSATITPRGKLLTLLVVVAFMLLVALVLWSLWSRQKVKAEPPGVFAHTTVSSYLA